MNTLTPKQKAILLAIRNFYAHSGKMPSIRQLREEVSKHGLKIKSSRSVFNYLNSLEEKGYINRLPNRGGIKLVDNSGSLFIEVPVFGSANAGSPTMIAEQNVEGYLKVSKRLVSSKNLFAIRVYGDSMNQCTIGGKKIDSGDYILVDPNYKNFSDGDKVLVVIDGLATIKIYKRIRKGLIGLIPNSSNKRHKPIYLTPEDSFIINGKVADVLKDIE